MKIKIECFKCGRKLKKIIHDKILYIVINKSEVYYFCSENCIIQKSKDYMLFKYPLKIIKVRCLMSYYNLYSFHNVLGNSFDKMQYDINIFKNREELILEFV